MGDLISDPTGGIFGGSSTGGSFSPFDSIFGMMGIHASAPPPRSYNRELVSTLNTQIGLAPAIYAAESNPDWGQPAYTRLALQNLGILAPGAEAIYGGMASRGRARTAADIAGIAPGLADTYAGLNPDQQQLMGTLNEQARQALAAGSTLMPNDIYGITNQTRANWANRGLGASGPAALDEAVRLATAGEGLRQQRQQFAGNVAGLNYQNLQPVYDILGRVGTDQSAGLGYGQLIGQTWQGLGPLFSPESAYAHDIYSQRYSTQAAINAANASNNASMWSSLMSMGGGMAACWAAREVFGEENPKWLRFRNWLLRRAPKKLRDWYLAHGEEWAERLRMNPRVKATVRRWMERRI